MKTLPTGLVTLAGLGAGLLSAPQGAAAQAAGCTPMERPVIRVGFNFSCNCTLVREEGGPQRWIFHSEPRVDQADAVAELRAGDVIVTADERPITTEAGGAAFSRLLEGRPVVLGVRRDGQLATARPVPKRECEEPLSSRVASTLTDSPSGLVTRGYIGVGLATSATVQTPPGGPAVWRFHEAPVVVGVAEGSPAERSGLQVGDSVMSVDGHPITSTEGGRRFGAARPGETIILEVRRGNTTHRFGVEVADPNATPVRLSGSRVEVIGKVHLDRVGDRIIIRADSGSMTIMVTRSLTIRATP